MSPADTIERQLVADGPVAKTARAGSDALLNVSFGFIRP